MDSPAQQCTKRRRPPLPCRWLELIDGMRGILKNKGYSQAPR